MKLFWAYYFRTSYPINKTKSGKKNYGIQFNKIGLDDYFFLLIAAFDDKFRYKINYFKSTS